MPANHRETPALDEEDVNLDLDLDLLPREKWSLSPYLYLYQNFWCPSDVLPAVISVQAHFRSKPSDILLATKPKSGTTWLKALSFALLHRHHFDHHHPNHPLLSSNPHSLVPSLEYPPPGTIPDHLLHLSSIDPPRLLSTHLPYSALPRDTRSSDSRVIYLCRNPFDTIVSYLKFEEVVNKGREPEEADLEECVDRFIRGVEGFGPHWDHVLGYWNASLESPGKVLFMKYEDLKGDEMSEIKRLAGFLGVPFTREEEESGVVGGISELCSLRKLKDLEVNKSGKLPHDVENKAFFRKGEVGDWKNYMSPALFNRLDIVVREKFRGSGLTFEVDI